MLPQWMAAPLSALVMSLDIGKDQTCRIWSVAQPPESLAPVSDGYRRLPAPMRQQLRHQFQKGTFPLRRTQVTGSRSPTPLNVRRIFDAIAQRAEEGGIVRLGHVVGTIQPVTLQLRTSTCPHGCTLSIGRCECSDCDKGLVGEEVHAGVEE